MYFYAFFYVKAKAVEVKDIKAKPEEKKASIVDPKIDPENKPVAKDPLHILLNTRVLEGKVFVSLEIKNVSGKPMEKVRAFVKMPKGLSVESYGDFRLHKSVRSVLQCEIPKIALQGIEKKYCIFLVRRAGKYTVMSKVKQGKLTFSNQITFEKSNVHE